MTTQTAEAVTAGVGDASRGLRTQVEAAKAASPALGLADRAQKDAVLHRAAELLRERVADVLEANAADVAEARDHLSDAMIDRLLLNPERVEALAASLEDLALLDDPVGETIDRATSDSGLEIERVRVPLGVIASIYESRPNVTIDIGAICLKSGNAIVLRGGHEALRSNRLLAEVLRDALADQSLPSDAVQLVRSTDRALVGELLAMSDLIDLMVPRGGQALINRVREQASMAVVAGGVGICHTYVDAEADLEMALSVVDNAKRRRVSICNALDVMLVHEDIAEPFLSELGRRWAADGPTPVELRADARARGFLFSTGARTAPAGPDDFDTEFLSLTAAVGVVDSSEAALAHIAEHGSGHSEAVITSDDALAQRFLREVDAAAVYVNASTQFTDGGQFGLGAEVGISTGKLHARGPMGLRELTSYKWVIRGDGHVRPG